MLKFLSKYIKLNFFQELCLIFLLTLLLFNTFQTFQFKWNTNRQKLFLLYHFSIVFAYLFVVFLSLLKGGVIKKIYTQFMGLQIPRGAKTAIIVVLIGNFIAIGFAKPNYPFYDVGMFRWSSTFTNEDKIMHVPKYFYKQDGKTTIIELRKESVTALAPHLGWGYNHEFTFATTFHNKGQQENFEYLSNLFKEKGIDTLWVGIHTIDYQTQKIIFSDNLCDAIQINNTEKLHYGKIYIPEYQFNKCDLSF